MEIIFHFFYETYKNTSQNCPFYATPNVYVFSVCKITKTWKLYSFLSEESIYICKAEVFGVLVSDIMKQESQRASLLTIFIKRKYLPTVLVLNPK